MTAPDTHDDGHLIPVREWERVVEEAENVVRKAERMMLGASSFPSVDGFIAAKYNGGAQPGGRPTFGVLHDAETPLANGYAHSISNYFTRNTNETSAHFMLGPDATFQLLDTSLVAWHCGNGNQRSIGVEQAGYARLTRAEWLSADGIRQLQRLAALMKDIQTAHGIGPYFMSDEDLRRAWRGEIVGGWSTHDQCRRVLGGTTHTDPMPNFPFDSLLGMLGGVTPAPAPQPTRPPVPQKLRWILPRGHYVGDIKGPRESHGGDPRYDSAEVIKLVKNCQEWFIYHGCVPGVWNFEASQWDDGRFQRPWSTDAAIRWHAKFYRGQPYPDQIWSDDYERLARA